MKTRLLMIVLVVLGLFILCNTMAAEALTFFKPDTVNYWGQNLFPSESWTSSDPNDNSKDSIGVPNITGVGGTIDAGFLTRVYFQYSKWGSVLADRAGHLFVDVGCDFDWDWVVDPLDGSIYDITGVSVSPRKGINDTRYILSDTAWTFTSGDIRNDHPVQLDVAGLGLTAVSGATAVFAEDSTGAAFSSLVDGSGPLIDLGGKGFIIGWFHLCANDVVLEKIPEPATLLLLGTGLISFAGLSRRKVFKK